MNKQNKKDKNTEASNISVTSKSKFIYYLIMFFIPIAFILLLEVMLRLFGYGHNLDLFVKSKNFPGYYEINNKVANRFFTKYDGTSPSNDLFLIEKPENSYRLFVMGCSTTRGFPYEMNVTFSRILNYRLQDAFPDKKIEVVNTAMAAVNSYTQADYIDEILKMKPDAILIYTGHNEFYGALGVGSVENGGNVRWMKKLHIFLIKYRTYQLVQNVVSHFMGLFVHEKVQTSATLMERIVKEKAIPYKSKMYNDGIEQFKINMSEVVYKITKAKVPLIFSNVVSNIRGNPPFNSVKTEGYPTANEAFGRAVVLESEHKFKEARQMFYLAKDLDGIRFRAPEDINLVISEIGKKYNIPVLDMKSVFENASPNGIIGNNLMIEHLHPNVDGYFLMADAFFNEMRRDHFIAAIWDTTKIRSAQYYRNNWGFTPLDSLVADLKIKKLKSGWPFKPEGVENTFRSSYKPTSMIDSIAFMCIKYSNVSIETKHFDLANIYLSMGEKRKAFNEYYSLIKSAPYVCDMYYKPLDLLMEMKDYSKALDLMLGMPNHDTIFFANMQIGKIYQNLNEHKLAIQSFEMAKKAIKGNYNLEFLLISEINSYSALNDSAGLKKSIQEIRIVNPNFNMGDAKKKEIVVYLDSEVKDLIMMAMKEAKSQNYNKAIDLLEKSLKIKETAYALKILGSIYFQLHDFRALAYFERAYQLEPKDENTLNNLFVLYLNNGNITMASKILSEYKNLSANSKRVQQLTDLLNRKMSKNK